MVDLPTVTLDITLTDLYKKASPRYADRRIAHVFCGVTSALALTPNFPRNRKYVYQDGAFNNVAPEDVTEETRQSLAVKFLSLVPQRDAFIAGNTPVIFFHTGISPEQRAHDIAEASETLKVVEAGQKPEAVFCNGPSDVASAAKRHGFDLVTSKIIVDGVAEAGSSSDGTLKPLVDLDALWLVNSKEGLAKSGLPTPKAKFLEIEKYDAGSDLSISKDRWLDEQVDRIVTSIRTHKLPFVMKGNQSFAGAGTYVVTSESDRTSLIDDFNSNGSLRRLLDHISPENEHLNVATFLLTDMVEDAVSDVGLTFFVTESGKPIFLAASEQMIDRENAAWIGSTIAYSRQDQLRKKLEHLMNQTTDWLHAQGYFGPVGADILETPEGDLQIVDLNVRTSGSLCLPLMKTHFTSRGLTAASSFSITVRESRKEFIDQWRIEFTEGKMCIVAWYEESRLQESYGDVVVGAKDETELAKMIERVRSVSKQVTF